MALNAHHCTFRDTHITGWSCISNAEYYPFIQVLLNPVKYSGQLAHLIENWDLVAIGNLRCSTG
jgi:hypothetical protein